jgi:hypothetical protein
VQFFDARRFVQFARDALNVCRSRKMPKALAMYGSAIATIVLQVEHRHRPVVFDDQHVGITIS